MRAAGAAPEERRLLREAAWRWVAIGLFATVGVARAVADSGDVLREIQVQAMKRGRSPVAHWGPEAGRYVSWRDHTLRLVPVYTYGTAGAGPGIDLDSYTGARSRYRDRAALERLYGVLPRRTWNAAAEYMDQTDVAALQRAALAAGRRNVILVVFDGMDWDTARAAAIHAAGGAKFDTGRGVGLHFMDYTARGTSEFGFAVASPSDDHHAGVVDGQRVRDEGGGLEGGYDAAQGGRNPWSRGTNPGYLIARRDGALARHAIPDSAATATAFCSGVKTFNASINVDPRGRKLPTVAHEAQASGKAIGIVTSVPVSHATPAAAYAQNVDRSDYQDLTRDLLGLRSASHPQQPLAGVDVLIGCGFGVVAQADSGQGSNFVPGNRYVAEPDLRSVDSTRGGRYVVSTRVTGMPGGEHLRADAARAAAAGHRLFGLYGVTAAGGHLPYRTADGRYDPVGGRSAAESYTAADLQENPTLADMVTAALTVLERDPEGFWLMIEAGDVDWASHDANLDTAVGAVLSGDEAVRVVTDWVDRKSTWNDSVLVVTSDHGHYLILTRPAALVAETPDS